MNGSETKISDLGFATYRAYTDWLHLTEEVGFFTFERLGSVQRILDQNVTVEHLVCGEEKNCDELSQLGNKLHSIATYLFFRLLLDLLKKRDIFFVCIVYTAISRAF